MKHSIWLNIIHILKNGDIIKSDHPKAIYQNPEFISVANIFR